MAAGRPIHDVRLGDDGPERQPARNALRTTDDIRLDAGVFDREHLAGSSHTALHFVDDEQDAMFVAERPQFAQELWRGDVIAAFALDRLDEDRGNLVWWCGAVEEVFQF